MSYPGPCLCHLIGYQTQNCFDCVFILVLTAKSSKNYGNMLIKLFDTRGGVCLVAFANDKLFPFLLNAATVSFCETKEPPGPVKNIDVHIHCKIKRRWNRV